MIALAAVAIPATLGLIGVVVTAVLSRRSARESNAVDRDQLSLEKLRLALSTQGDQIDRLVAQAAASDARADQADERADQLEAGLRAAQEEVAACHRERAEERTAYRAELADVRAQIEGTNNP